MAHLVVHCPKCATKLRVGDASQGKAVSCPRCGHAFGIGLRKPKPGAEQAPKTPAARPAGAPKPAPAGKPPAAPPPKAAPAPKPAPAPEAQPQAPRKDGQPAFEEESSESAERDRKPAPPPTPNISPASQPPAGGKLPRVSPASAFGPFMCGVGGIWTVIDNFTLCGGVNKIDPSAKLQAVLLFVPIYANLYLSTIIKALNRVAQERQLPLSPLSDSVVLNFIFPILPLYRMRKRYNEIANALGR